MGNADRDFLQFTGTIPDLSCESLYDSADAGDLSAVLWHSQLHMFSGNY